MNNDFQNRRSPTNPRDGKYQPNQQKISPGGYKQNRPQQNPNYNSQRF